MSRKARSGLYILILVFMVITVLTLLSGISFAIWKITSIFNQKSKYCQTESCLLKSADVVSSLDRHIDPCDDFYRYSCGKWSEHHLEHEWDDKFSNFEKMQESVKLNLKRFLTFTSRKTDSKVVKMTRDFYTSCENLDNTKDYASLSKHMKALNMTKIPRFFHSMERKPYNFNWTEMAVNFKKILAVDVIFGVSVDRNFLNTSENVIHLRLQRQHSPLPQVSYLEKLDTAYVDLYKELIGKVITSFLSQDMTLDNEILNQATKTIWDITSKITKAGNNIKEDESDQLESHIRSITINDLDQITSTVIDLPNKSFWKTYFSMLFSQHDFNLDFDKDLVYYNSLELKPILAIIFYIDRLSGYEIELYFWWMSLYTMIGSTDIALSKEIAEIFDKYWSHNCVDITLKYMSYAIAFGFVNKHTFDETEAGVNEMIGNIKNVFIKRINDIHWLDSKTKAANAEKVQQMANLIGLEKWAFDQNEVEEFYGNIDIRNDTFLDNIMSFIQEYTPEEFSCLRNKPSHKWRLFTTVGAVHQRDRNAINIPLAILSFPFYSLGVPALDYGSMGATLGHELIHGFDNGGIKFDKKGNFKEWWSKKSLRQFKAKTKCFVDQYDHYYYGNGRVNGTLTLDENLADNSGIRMAYLAYKKHYMKKGTEKILPGFEDFTNDQLFFLGYATFWCEKEPSDAAKEASLTNVHSPKSIRVLGTLQNMQEFSDTFNCTKGSKMNPNRARCLLW